MRRPIVLFLAAVLLTGCGEANQSTSSGTNQNSAPTSTVGQTGNTGSQPTEGTVPTQVTPVDPGSSGPTGETAQLPVDRATRSLAQHLSLQPADITVTSSEEVEWPNSALGCPSPDMMYLEVITPGYRMVFNAGGTEYQVHTNSDASSMVLCQDGKATLLPAPQGQ